MATANCSTRCVGEQSSSGVAELRNRRTRPERYCADRIVRACSVSSPIVATRILDAANFSWPRMRATKSTATCWPYRSAVVSRTNASTVRVRPENVGLVPHRHRGLISLAGDDGAGGRSVSQDGEPRRVHAIGGNRRVHRRRHVGGREAKHLAAPVAAHHHALYAVRDRPSASVAATTSPASTQDRM